MTVLFQSGLKTKAGADLEMPVSLPVGRETGISRSDPAVFLFRLEKKLSFQDLTPLLPFRLEGKLSFQDLTPLLPFRLEGKLSFQDLTPLLPRRGC
jgi:hypothetical protein